MSRTSQLICAWCGPLLVAIFVIALVPLAEFIPPPAPTDSAEEIAAMYNGNVDGIRLGLLLATVSMALIAPWGVAVASQTRRIEGGRTLTYVQLACAAIGTTLAVTMLMVWGTAAFRPDDLSADVTRMLNDLGWFLFLFDWAPFSVWAAAIGLVILSDKRPDPIFPRWAGYLNFWLAFLFVPAGLMIFFKTGAFAFNGLLGMYVPLLAFLVWVVVMTALVIKAVNRESADDIVEAPAGVPEIATEPAPQHELA